MIRKNNNITGISIDNKEYKLSQYAADRQLFLDGTKKSLQHCLNTLDKFYAMSG
jgi:hypothetical protein